MYRLIEVFLPLFLFLFLTGTAHAEVQLYTGLSSGSLAMSETQGAETYKHQNQFFIGHFGAVLGGAFVFVAGSLGLGFKGELAWVGDSVDRSLSGSSSSVGYRNESQRLLGGLVLSVRPGPLAFDFEYYPSITNNVIYSDEKSENPFRKNDKWTGTGYGFTLGFKFLPPMRNFISFRKLIYTKADFAGIVADLPSDIYSKPEINEVLFGFGSEF